MFFIFITIFLQIIIESLPVSSSGHLTLLEKISDHSLTSGFDYFLHGPTIIILLIVFYKEWSNFVFLLLKSLINFLNDSIKDSSKNLFIMFIKIVSLVAISNFVTTLIWLFFSLYIKKQPWFDSDIVLLVGFCFTALALFSLRCAVTNENRLSLQFLLGTRPSVYEKNKKDYLKYLLLGLVQGVALFPGISRFASVYVTSRFLNFSPRRAFQITFLIQFPLIVAGFFLGSYKIFKSGEYLILFSWKIFLAIIFATIISIYLFIWVKSLAQRNKLFLFSYYMLIPILVLIFLSIINLQVITLLF